MKYNTKHNRRQLAAILAAAAIIHWAAPHDPHWIIDSIPFLWAASRLADPNRKALIGPGRISIYELLRGKPYPFVPANGSSS